MTVYTSSILAALLELFFEWRGIFPCAETYRRAVELALAHCMNGERKTISNAILEAGKDQQDWSSYYKVYSRSPWDGEGLYEPIHTFWIADHLGRGWERRPLVAGIDTTGVKKTGKKIPHTQYFRDPMSPPFHVNLQWGQRLLDISALIPRDSLEKGPSRGIPILVKCSPRPRKPGRKAPPEKQREYKVALERCSLPRIAREEVQKQRKRLDQLGAHDELLVMVGDGEFANRKIFQAEWDRVAWLCRTRKDLALFYPWKAETHHQAPRGRRRKYAEKAPTPEELRQDEHVPWKQTEVWVGEHPCVVKYKSLGGVLWKKARGAVVRILVTGGLPYRPPGAKKKSSRDPAYLMYMGPRLPDEWLLQWYLWRAEVEVNIRDEKQLFGVGQAQVWSEKSVERCPEFQGAVYGCMLVAALRANGQQRGEFYLPLPRWNRRKPWQRPSSQEIVRKLRREISSAILQGKGNFEGFVDTALVQRSPQKSSPDPVRTQLELSGVG
jgi:hypothetical protein